MKLEKLWYSFLDGEQYNVLDNFYFDTEHTEWNNTIKKNFTLILDDFQKIYDSNDIGIVPYINEKLSDDHKKWTFFPLKYWGKEYKENIEKVEKTAEILFQFPEIISAAFSILQPNTSIKPHVGDTNAIIRNHLGLIIPDSLPKCGFQVGEELKNWKENEILSFCDAQRHQAWNNTKKLRAVLIFDVIRPEFFSQKDKICESMTKILWWQTKFQHYYFLGKLPKAVRRLLI